MSKEMEESSTEFTAEDVLSAFAEGSGEPAPAVTAATEFPVEEEVKAKQEGSKPEAPATPAYVTPDILAAFEARLTKQVDKVAGNYGEVKKLFEETVKRVEAQPASKGKSEAEIDQEAWAELFADFPELADSVTKGVSAEVQKAVAKASGSQLSEASIAKLVQQSISEALRTEKESSRKEALDDLRIRHPSFYSEKQYEGEDWTEWRGTLSQARLHKLDNTWDTEFVSDQIEAFQDWRTSRASRKQTSKATLENAVTPRGVSRPASAADISAEQAFLRAAGEL